MHTLTLTKTMELLTENSQQMATIKHDLTHIINSKQSVMAEHHSKNPYYEV